MTRLVVFAHEARDVTFDEDAEASNQAPGHATDPKEGGDGSTSRVKPDGKGAGGSDSKRRDGGETATAIELSTEEDERIADLFERDLGIDPDDEDLEGEPTTGTTSGGKQPGGEGASGGDLEGRTGDDTRIGGTGPGGDKARPDGQGKGSETGGRGGSEAGGKDGQKGGVWWAVARRVHA
jgi:hypothetical protein